MIICLHVRFKLEIHFWYKNLKNLTQSGHHHDIADFIIGSLPFWDMQGFLLQIFLFLFCFSFPYRVN